MTDEFTKSGPIRSNKLLYVISLNHFINDGSTFLIASLFPAMEVAFRFSTYYIGLLVAIGYLLSMFLQPVTGHLAEKYRSLTLLSLGMSIMAVSMFIFTISKTFSMILLAFVILRIGSSFFHPVGTLFVSRAYAGEALDKSMGFESAFGNLGIVFAFLVSAPLFLAFGWSGPFILYASAEIVAVIANLLLESRSRSRFENTNETKQKELDQRVETEESNVGKSGILGLPLFFVIIGFVTGGSNAVFSNFGNLFLYHMGFSYGIANDLIGGFVGFGFIGALVSGWMINRISRVRLLFLAYMVAGISTLAFSYFRTETYIVAITLLITGFAISITFPAVYSELSDLGRGKTAKGEGAGYGMLFSSQIAGATIMGYVGGLFSGSYGLLFSFLIAFFLLILAALLVAFWSRYRRRFVS